MNKNNNESSVFISRDDVERLTGRTYFKAQCKALDELGIPYIKSAGGMPLVRTVDLVAPAPRLTRAPRFDRIAG